MHYKEYYYEDVFYTSIFILFCLQIINNSFINKYFVFYWSFILAPQWLHRSSPIYIPATDIESY